MPKFETPEPISVVLELGVANVRIAASDRTDTIAETFRRQAGHRQRRGDGGRSWNAGDPHTLLDAGRDEPVAGIGHARHARVGDEHDGASIAQRLHQLRKARRLDVLVETHDPATGRHTESGGERPEPPGVLGRHHIRIGKYLGEPW